MRSKPSHLKYTDLCIYIDNTIYNRDENNTPTSLRKLSEEEQSKVYAYLCSLIVALAHKKKLFPTWEQYEEFTYLYAANVYMRLISDKQSFDGTTGRLKPIKSVLNYIKNTIGFTAIDYRNSAYEQIISLDHEGPEVYHGVSEFCRSQVEQLCSESAWDLVHDNLDEIHSIIKQVLDNSIYKRSKERNAVELSILLSLNNLLSLTQAQKSLAASKRAKIIAAKLNNWRDNVVLWDDKLDKNILIILIERIFEQIQKNIDQDKADNYVPEDVVKDILSSALPSYGTNNMEED